MPLLKKVMEEKYGLQSQWNTQEVLGTFGYRVWKTIRRLWPQFQGNIQLKRMATIAQVWCLQGWTLDFRRALNDMEVDRTASLFLVINDFPGTTNTPDKPVWKLHNHVKKIYKKFPRLSVPQHLELADDDELQKLSEAIAAAKTRVEGCSSFLKAAIKLDTLSLIAANPHISIHVYPLL
ncbi:hypothetical protein FXO38_19916 [Capsicum annuum]|nr:hypothetical protein FXO38_19916 [Capsicum annuum]